MKLEFFRKKSGRDRGESGPLRILLCGNDEGIGGAQVAFRRLADFLAQDPGFELAVIPIGDRQDEGPGDRVAEHSIARLRSNSGTVIKAAALGRAVLRARKFDPDIFLTVGLAQSANLIMDNLPDHAEGIAYDFIADRSPQDLLLRTSLESFAKICVQSPSMVPRLVEAGLPAQRLDWAPCFPGEVYFDHAKTGVSLVRSEIRLAYFGRLAPNKGLGVFIEALASCADVPWRFDIWGTGPEADRIAKCADAFELGSRVTLKGRYPDGAEAAKLMASYDAVVMPSQCLEGVPLVLIEAMALGVPALCSDVGAMKDVCVGNPDFLLSRSDSPGLARTVRKLYRALESGQIDHSRLRMFFETNFSDAAVANTWRRLLCSHSNGSWVKTL